MRFLHYSPTEIKKLIKNFYPKGYRQYIGKMKPIGLWLSVEGEDDWEKWCREGNFRLHDLKYKYEVKLKKTSSILYVKTIEELEAFTDQYQETFETYIKTKKGAIRNLPLFLKGKLKDFYEGTYVLREKLVIHIQWEKVKKEYDGIVIAPYQWECRLRNKFMWYYSWDCASGCIWNIDAIATMDLISKTTNLIEAGEQLVYNSRPLLSLGYEKRLKI